MRIRRTRRALTFLAVAGATVLATAACGPTGNDAADSPSTSTSADSSSSDSSASSSSSSGKESDTSASTGGKSGSSAQGSGSSGTSGTSGNTGGTSGSSSGKGGTSGSSSGKGDATCTTDDTKIALVETGGTLPVILIKAVNASGGRCDIYGFPTVGYPGAQAAIGANEDSKPQAVVTLAPGQSAYAAIALPSGAHTHREKTLTISLHGRDMGPIDGQTTVTAPGAAGLALSDSSMVTYWQSSEESALQ
ncbi:DUF4232 domain-containing protein [Streptomyces sp. NBC_01387]|uniref:DUF4232 domain-containing protein n=1 Tax=unclassified Streptomyces TaxID=2593676 RepID=UPI0020257062|nr:MULTISPECIES: DUF4232 domain-containing protein [unclassified Streptomyces]MCX4549076.1 DUF4232 domain-containing protein [Streptomyces sp. NBC_01500]WSV54682.1 DUF4232 domain-containing protein [Streptomyces sp. NBC_01014]